MRNWEQEQENLRLFGMEGKKGQDGQNLATQLFGFSVNWAELCPVI